MFIEELAALILGVSREYDLDEITEIEIEDKLIEQFNIDFEDFENIAKALVKFTQPFYKKDKRHYCFGELMESGLFRAVFRVTGE